jgi:hypothetical protein
MKDEIMQFGWKTLVEKNIWEKQECVWRLVEELFLEE